MPDPTAIERTVADYFAAIRDGDVEAWLDCFATDVVSHDPVGAPPHKGKQALRAFFEGIDGAFESVSLTEESVFVAGDGAAVKWSGEGVGKNGAEVSFEGIDIFRVDDDGKIDRIWAYWNPAPVLEKITR